MLDGEVKLSIQRIPTPEAIETAKIIFEIIPK